jgi:hypothetical protein
MAKKQMPRSSDPAVPCLGEEPEGTVTVEVPNGIARDREPSITPGFLQGPWNYSVEQTVSWPGGNRSGE